ncbi:MAG: LD-carboxypeptidase [Gammaproteobacteria bacterium]|nr:LD-carboxypeptidase [Gammaproteobacteria bacterium]
MNYIISPALNRGDTIGLIAPSSPLQPGRLEAGTSYLSQKGFKVKPGRHLHDGDRFLAGTDENRAADIMEFICDPEIKAIMAVAGGYGSQRLLPLLDFELIKKNPKIITGFSDTTALQLGLLKMTGLVSYTGFTFRDVDKPDIDSLVDETLMSCLTDKSITITEGIAVNPGKVKAPLIGGNLECLISLMGTPYQPDYRNCILLIEDVFAEPFQTDSRLSQLHLAGIFDHVAGVIFGTFSNCIANHNPERDGTIQDVISEWSQKIKVPTVKEFPYGHIDRRCMLPIGKEIILEVNDQDGVKVIF